MENNDKLKNLIKSKIAISKFKEENIVMNKNNFIKTVSVACVFVFLTTGIVFAKDIEKLVKRFVF